MDRRHPIRARAKCALPIVAALCFLLAPLVTHADALGKQVFLVAKCDRCHGVGTADIEPKKPRASDLGHVGATRDAAWIRGYMLRKERIQDEPHPVAWKGSEADLDALVAWLASLK